MSEYNITHMARKKSKQEVGNLRFVVFDLSPYQIHSGLWVILHFLRLPLDVNRL